jgi:hypothetical protein
MAVLHRVASGQIIPPQRSGPLTPLLLRMMAQAPADRPSMAEVSRTLTLPLSLPSIEVRGTANPPAERSVAARTLPVSRSELSDAESGTAGPRPHAERRTGPPVAPSSSGEARRGRPKTAAMVAIAGVVLAVALAAGFFLVSRGDGGQGAVAASSAQEQADAGASPTQESISSSSGSEQREATGSASQAGAGAELAAAVSDYYALMPANTDAGWALLTPGFQSGIARDRDYYNSFWSGVQRVVATDVTGTAPDSVEATITYYFTDGTVSVERTAYRLVRDGGVLKIDSSSVLSSRAG